MIYSANLRPAKMKNIIMNNILVRLTLIILAVFIVATLIVPPEELKRFMDAGRIAIYSVLWYVVAQRAWHLYWRPGPRTGGEVAAVALSTLAATILIHAIWIPLRRDFSHLFPDWVVPGYIDSFVVLMFCVSGAGFLMPIGNVAGVTPPRNFWFLLSAAVIFGLVLGLMIGLGISGASY